MSLGSVLNQAGAGSYTRNQILSDATKIAYGLTEAATPDDVFNNILLKFAMEAMDAGIVNVTVKTASGTPVSNLLISNLVDKDGSPVYTNDSGFASGLATVGNKSIGFSGYADVTEASQSVEVVKGNTYNINLTTTFRNFLEIAENGNWQFTDNVTRVDVSVGAAGGGGCGAVTYETNEAGWGGAGGDAVIQEDVSFTPFTKYSAVVGKGGAKGNKSTTTTGAAGKDGGNSSFLGITAKGGEGADRGGSVPTGNGNGGKIDQTGGAGTKNIFSSFTEEKPYGGGGAGGITPVSWISGEIPATGKSGGAPGGGKSGDVNSKTSVKNSDNGVDGLGGGGGGASWLRNGSSSSYQNYHGEAGRGGNGIIAIRMHLKVAS